MRILLDESLPKRLKNDFKEFHVRTIPEMGWQGKKNGELLRLMEDKFDIFMTADQNLQYQINLRQTRISVIVFVSVSNRYFSLKCLVDKTLKYLKSGNIKGIVRITD